MKLFVTLATALIVLSIAPEATTLLQQPADTYADEGVNAAGWGNILWAVIALVALVMFVALAMISLRGSKRPRVGE